MGGWRVRPGPGFEQSSTIDNQVVAASEQHRRAPARAPDTDLRSLADVRHDGWLTTPGLPANAGSANQRLSALLARSEHTRVPGHQL